MSFRLANVTITTHPRTGLPVTSGTVRGTMDGQLRVTQTTGEPSGGRNTRPGTDPNAPGDDDPGLPYGFEDVPETGPLGP